MYIVICDYHVIILVSNKSEWYIAMCQHVLLFEYYFCLILKKSRASNLCAHECDMWHIHKYFKFYF
jgi:hypothetical protein